MLADLKSGYSKALSRDVGSVRLGGDKGVRALTHFDDTTRRAIPTQYKGHLFRSRFEANTARLIDAMNVPWVYEPTSFLLETPTGEVHYQPDFYLPTMHLWIEARGYQSAHGDSQIEAFSSLICNGGIDEDMRLRPPVKTYTTEGAAPLSLPYAESSAPDYLVLSDPPSFSEWFGRFGTGWSDSVWLAACTDCHQVFFHGGGSFQCRVCGAWDGDHHLFWMEPISVRAGVIWAGHRRAVDLILGR